MLVALCDECTILQKTTPAVVAVVAHIIRAGAQPGDSLFTMHLCREHWGIVQPGLLALKAQDVRLPIAPKDPPPTEAEAASERAIEATVDVITEEAQDKPAPRPSTPGPGGQDFGKVSA